MTEWTRQDLRGTIEVLPHWWDYLSGDVDDRHIEALRRESMAAVADLDGPDDPRAQQTVDMAMTALSEAGRRIVALGLVARMEGTVEGLYVSDGGVPKRPVEQAQIGFRGVQGDRQAERRHHGRPWQALCLWSSEVIAALQAEGHVIAPGAAGENCTIAGLDWAVLRPGARLRMGEVRAEISAPALPCVKNAQWFVDGDFMQMSHDRYPGRSRWYATVLQPGYVGVGDPVVVEP